MWNFMHYNYAHIIYGQVHKYLDSADFHIQNIRTWIVKQSKRGWSVDFQLKFPLKKKKIKTGKEWQFGVFFVLFLRSPSIFNRINCLINSHDQFLSYFTANECHISLIIDPKRYLCIWRRLKNETNISERDREREQKLLRGQFNTSNLTEEELWAQEQ